jgi:hypothetical protein
MDRRKFKFTATVTDAEDGTTKNPTFMCYWSPENDDTLDAVARSAAAQMTVDTRKKWLPISAEFVEAIAA